MFGLEKTAIYAIGAGVLALALMGSIIWLINYGQKLGELQVENTRLEGEIEKASDWAEIQLAIMTAKDLALEDWQTTASNFEIAFNAALLDRPEPEIITRWRDLATTVPVAVPLGNCDTAAVEAWKILNTAGITGGSFWDSEPIDSSDSSSGLPLQEWQQRYLRFKQDVRAQIQPSTHLMLLSPVYTSPYPQQSWNVPRNLDSPSENSLWLLSSPTDPSSSELAPTTFWP